MEKVPALRAHRGSFDCAPRDETARDSAQDDNFYINRPLKLKLMSIHLVRGGDPAGVGVEEEEENHAEGHQVHVDQEEDSAVVKAPARLHATNRVDRAEDGGQGGDDEKRSGAVVGEVGEDEGCGETG
jgi:hypothetical protein